MKTTVYLLKTNYFANLGFEKILINCEKKEIIKHKHFR